MKVSLNWLKEYLDLDQSPEEIAEAMTLSGLESEGIEEIDGDVIFEIGLTPNLGHCMSIIGIARELSAILQIPMRKKEISFSELEGSHEKTIEIADGEQCPMYCYRVIEGLKLVDSPKWLVKRLEAAGIRSVNCVVDIGNYVMLETGQPLHLFDRDRLQANELVIRVSDGDGKMQTLDEVARSIPDGVLLVCDGKKPVAIAGVMGELSTAVTDTTKNVLIEAAVFSPNAVRKSSKLVGVRSDSSQRFERGIDPEGTKWAIDMAAAYLADLCDGKVVGDIQEAVAKAHRPHVIEFEPKRANRILGLELSISEMCVLLERLEIQILQRREEMVRVAVPSYRNDLRVEIDLVEEIGRMYGFNNIPRTLPRHVSSMISHAPIFVIEQEMRSICVGLGLQECLTCDLISPQLAKLTGEKALSEESQIHVLYPASIDQSVLRTSLLPGLLQTVKFNHDRQCMDIQAFEVGHIHFKDEEQYYCQPTLGIILSGAESPYHFEKKPKETDFFTLKGTIENVLSKGQIKGASFEVSHLQNFHPNRQARIIFDEICLGALGEVHPAHLRELGIDKRVYYAEINLQDWMALVKPHGRMQAFSPFPKSERDWTITLAEKTAIGTVLAEIKKQNLPILENIFLLDLYKSEKIGKDRKNATFRFQYRDINRTIASEEIEKHHGELIEHIAKKFAFV